MVGPGWVGRPGTGGGADGSVTGSAGCQGQRYNRGV